MRANQSYPCTQLEYAWRVLSEVSPMTASVWHSRDDSHNSAVWGLSDSSCTTL